ncbi:MAG: hypothetical protein LBG72_09075 [Spirochaetaceae bacterium]|jgi:hypothetical protein|nr:hypothetical protein [Spirochaetaceae bacterium]
MKNQLYRIVCAAFFMSAIAALIFAGCDYGTLGGADQTGECRPGSDAFTERMDFLSGIWYSHYAGIGRLDGYRIGKWKDFDVWGKAKSEELFSIGGFDSATASPYKGAPLNPDDYIVLYDDTVYGQQDDGSGGQTTWGFGYLGVVRALNIFNGDKNRGALIIEYIEGCSPQWLQRYPDAKDGQVPFFGIYYRVLSNDIVQMANAVDLAAMYAGDPYYTEKATLKEAIEANTVENEAEFISWGVVIPQDREK